MGDAFFVYHVWKLGPTNNINSLYIDTYARPFVEACMGMYLVCLLVELLSSSLEYVVCLL